MLQWEMLMRVLSGIWGLLNDGQALLLLLLLFVLGLRQGPPSADMGTVTNCFSSRVLPIPTP